MTTPREHAEIATRYYADDTLKCWTRSKNSNEDWSLWSNPSFGSHDIEYYVGHEPPPPDKRTITLTVNGKEWVLPEPLREEPEVGSTYWTVNGAVDSRAMGLQWVSHATERLALKHATLHATEANAQAWADFDKWCRGGG